MRSPVPGAYRRADLVLLFVLGILWGTAFTFITIGLDRFSPLLFAALRFDIMGLLIFVIAAARRRGSLVPRGARQWAAVGIASVLMTGSYHAFLFWGQQFTASGIAAVIVGLSPVITTGFTALLLREDRLGWRGAVGVLIGFGGILLLGSLKGGDPLDAQGLGELAVVVAIASWALGSVLVKKTKHGMDLFAFAAWQGLLGAAGLHVAAWLLEGRGEATWDAWGVGSLLYLAVISSGIGYLVYFRLIETVGPLRVNMVSYIAPVFANIAGLVVLKEELQVRAVLAFALIATSLTFVIRAKRPQPAPVPSASAAAPLHAEDPGRVGP